MSKVLEHPSHPEGGRKYGAFISVSSFLQLIETESEWKPTEQDIYADGLLKKKLPTVTTDPNKLEENAKQHLGSTSFDYVSGGAGEKATMDANRLAFRQWKA